MERYFAQVTAILTAIQQTQAEEMRRVASCCTDRLLAGGKLFFFGTGHSHLLAEEVYYRAGGLMNVTPILETALMLHEGGPKSTKLERLEGYAAILLEEYGVGEGDVLFVISNSGLNAAPLEMALGGKARGAIVVAMTNRAQSMQAQPRHSSGKKLYEVADLVLDNCGAVGDAAVRLEGADLAVGPTSTVAGAFMLNSIVVQVAANYVAQGLGPQVFVSANLAEGDQHNAELLKQDRASARGGGRDEQHGS